MLSRRRRLLYTLVTLLGLGIVAELGLRLSCGLRGEPPPVADDSLEYEWKWAETHLEAGSISIGPGPHRFDPRTGWSLQPGFQDREVTINSAGMRARREYARERSAGVPRVLLLGDSFTYGAWVPDEVTFAHVLETELWPGLEVLNLAVSGSGTDQQILAYEHEGRAYRGDVVVLGFYVDDASRNLLTFKLYQKPWFRLEGGSLRLHGLPLTPPEELYQDYLEGRRRIGPPWYQSRVYLALERLIARLQSRRTGPDSEEWHLLAALMQRFAETVRADGAVPLWMILPHADVESEGASRFEPLEELCEARARELDLPCLRLAPAFHAHRAAHPGDPLYRPREAGGHFSAAGHRLVARELEQRLRELIPGARRKP